MILEKIKNRLIQESKEYYIDLHLPFYYWNMQHEQVMINIPPKEPYCEIVAVAFNNEMVIDYQIRCLRKFFLTPFRYTVFDNSTVMGIVKSVCEKQNVGYVKLPEQKFLPSGCESYSHGIALNYIWRNYLKKSRARYILFLDHDIFCIQNFKCNDFISNNQPYYGLVHHRSTRVPFYLWPGFMLLDNFYLRKYKTELDFRPSLRLRGDTGVRNYALLYKDLNLDEKQMVKEKHVALDMTGDIMGMGYSLFDCGFLHCWNASNYANNDRTPLKMMKIFSLLEEKL